MSTQIEHWKPVIGWPRYEVSDLGNVRSDRGPIKTFKVIGYPSFNAVDGPRRKSLRVHREVLRSHVGDIAGMFARHLNDNPADCRLSNLEWGTQAQNEHDKFINGHALIGEKHHQAKLTIDQVNYIRASKESGVYLAKVYGVTPTAICAIRRNRSWRKAA